jgi:hemerythrin-like metal-binding protein
MGMKTLDDQHRQLLDAINELYDAMQASRGIEVVERTLSLMFEYTVFHIGEEEELMARHNYPDLEKHKRLHLEWVEKCVQLKEKQAEGSFLVAIELLRFLANWLTTHIKGEDKAFGVFMELRGQI